MLFYLSCRCKSGPTNLFGGSESTTTLAIAHVIARNVTKLVRGLISIAKPNATVSIFIALDVSIALEHLRLVLAPSIDIECTLQ